MLFNGVTRIVRFPQLVPIPQPYYRFSFMLNPTWVDDVNLGKTYSILKACNGLINIYCKNDDKEVTMFFEAPSHSCTRVCDISDFVNASMRIELYYGKSDFQVTVDYQQLYSKKKSNLPIPTDGEHNTAIVGGDLDPDGIMNGFVGNIDFFNVQYESGKSIEFYPLDTTWYNDDGAVTFTTTATKLYGLVYGDTIKYGKKFDIKRILETSENKFHIQRICSVANTYKFEIARERYQNNKYQFDITRYRTHKGTRPVTIFGLYIGATEGKKDGSLVSTNTDLNPIRLTPTNKRLPIPVAIRCIDGRTINGALITPVGETFRKWKLSKYADGPYENDIYIDEVIGNTNKIFYAIYDPPTEDIEDRTVKLNVQVIKNI